MTTKILKGHYASAYHLQAPVTTLSITASGYVAGSATYGVYTGAAATAACDVINRGTVKSGGTAVSLGDGGAVINGSSTDTGALVQGYGQGVDISGAAGTVTNQGIVRATSTLATAAAVTLKAGGAVTNGFAGSTAGLIDGSNGVLIKSDAGTVANFGTIEGNGSVPAVSYPAGYAILLYDGGSVTNAQAGAVIEGQSGVLIFGAAGTVKNLGAIRTASADPFNAVVLDTGGDVTNGSATDPTASIYGYFVGVALTDTGDVTNFGTIAAATTIPEDSTDTHAGIFMGGGGRVTNGSAADTSALITQGVVAPTTAGNPPATVVNFGSIGGGVLLGGGARVVNGAKSDTAATINGGLVAGTYRAGGTVTNYGTITSAVSDGAGVQFAGRFTNGSTDDATALVEGTFGTETSGVATVNNFGTVDGTGVSSGTIAANLDAGVAFMLGGSVTNAAGGLIEGQAGVLFEHSDGTVANFGTIQAISTAVYLEFGGLIANGSASNTSALIDGQVGVYFSTEAGTVTNFGTIVGGKAGKDAGVILVQGGVLTNGSASDTKASIYGYGAGILLAEPATITNFGTISAGAGHIGVIMGGSGVLTNGSVSDTTALIEEGVVSAPIGDLPAPTVTNFGTIEGGVQLGDAIPGTLVNYGTIEGGAQLGTAASLLAIESGSTILGSVSGGGGTLDLASGTGTIASIASGDIVAGGVPYDDFGALEIGKGAAFTLTGAGTVASVGSMSPPNVTTLDVEGTLGVTGSLTVSATVGGAGTLSLSGGETDFDAGADLSVAKVAVSGAATVVSVDTPLTFAGLWTQTGGTVAGTGSLTLTGAGDVLENLTISAAKVEIDAASATLAGAVNLTSLLTVISPKFTVAGATVLTGGGALQLSNIAAVTVMGASAASLLENSDKIEGTGNLGGGQLRLTNEAGGIIDGNAAKTLTIDTGGGAFVNDGLVETVRTGGLTIVGAVDNTGTLEAAGGTLTVDGAVTGAGGVRISGSTADFAAGFSQNVAFTSAGGELELADSRAYAGVISDFSRTGATSLDLEDIRFATATETYSGTAASGVLTVTDGTHTAKISLTGNYLSSVWNLTADSSGGTVVTDPTSATPSVHGLVAAMASFAPATSSGGSIAPPASTLGHALAAPQACHA